MPITDSRHIFVNTSTLNKLESFIYDETSISGFLLVESSINNFEYELDEATCGRISYWNKPRTFDRYSKKNNILLIVNSQDNKVYIFLQNDSDFNGRDHWDLTRISHGVVEITYLGLIHISKKDLAEILNYKEFPKHGSSQRINCYYGIFINNLKKKLRIND